MAENSVATPQTDLAAPLKSGGQLWVELNIGIGKHLKYHGTPQGQ